MKQPSTNYLSSPLPTCYADSSQEYEQENHDKNLANID
jgi:hypothetical protein